jgi:hypothetical protein
MKKEQNTPPPTVIIQSIWKKYVASKSLQRAGH